MDASYRNNQYYKFCAYGFLKNLRFFDAFLVLYLVDSGVSFTEIGILYAVREVFINVFEIPSGIIADTYGRKNTLAGSFLAYMASFVLFFLGNDFWIFLPAFLVYGVGDAFRTGTHKGMILDYLKLRGWEDQKIAYYGHTRSWSQRGSALSALLAGIIVFYSGSYQYIFLFSGLPYLVNLINILGYPKALNRSSGKPGGAPRRIAMTARSFFSVVFRRDVLRLIHTTALHTAFLQAIKDYIQLVMVQIALLLPFMLDTDPESKNGVVIGILYFFIYLGTSMASRRSSGIAARTGKNIPLLTLVLGFVFGVLSGFLFVQELWVLSMLAFAGIYLVENVRKPILTGFVADHTPGDILVSVISAQSLLKTIMTAALALAFGLIADHAGIGISILMVSGFLLIGTIGLNALPLKKVS